MALTTEQRSLLQLLLQGQVVWFQDGRAGVHLRVPIDVAEVKTDRMTYFAEPALRVTDAFAVLRPPGEHARTALP